MAQFRKEGESDIYNYEEHSKEDGIEGERLPINYITKAERQKRRRDAKKEREIREVVKEFLEEASHRDVPTVIETYKLPTVLGKPSMGRNNPQKDLFLEVFAKNGARQGKTCREVGIPYSKLKYWRNIDSEFSDEYELILLCAIEEVENRLIKQGSGELKGNVLANIAVLNARGRILGYGTGRGGGAKDLIRVGKDALDKFYETFKIDKSRRKKISAVERVKRNKNGTETMTRTVKVNED